MANPSDIIYFDHAAATPVRRELYALFPELARRCYANSEAAHRLACELRNELREAGKRLAGALFERDPPECEVIFGNSASELLALLGCLAWPARAAGAGSMLDHPAVQAMLRHGFAAVRTLPVDRRGLALAPAMPPDGTVKLAAVPWVQSEIGLVQSPETMLPELRRAFPEALTLLDMVQGAGKLAPPETLPDLAVISGHKFGAPGGAALLLLAPAARRLAPAFQQLRHRDYRTGRVEPLTALLLTHALELVAGERRENSVKVAQIGGLLRAGLAQRQLPNGNAISFTVAAAASSPYILHFLLPGYDGGVLVRMLSERNIMVAAGSACQAESKNPSAALTALGFPRRLAYSGLRLSFSPDNTAAEAQTFLRVLFEVLGTY